MKVIETLFGFFEVKDELSSRDAGLAVESRIHFNVDGAEWIGHQA